MIVTFVSQCEKKSLKRTRRILDAFANRIGSNVWQTAITEDGLATVKQLLRKSATKSTAVSCHRIKTRKQSQLMWIVGNKRKFNEVGIVPVNTTRRNLLHSEWENDWTYASSIQIVATIAALLHDIGKSTIGFQSKLIKGSTQGDPYRHEWISLKLFELIVDGCTTDIEWLTRLTTFENWLNHQIIHQSIEKRLLASPQEQTQISKMPPLAQWVAWLIVTHHRLPPVEAVFYPYKSIQRLQLKDLDFKRSLNQYYKKLKPIDYWVKNPKSFDQMTPKQLKDFWQFDNLVIHSAAWQKYIKRWAKKALNDPTLMQLSKQASIAPSQAISDPILLQLSRLCLMVGDHNYSSLKADDARCLKVDATFTHLAANTDRTQSNTPIKQTLEEHLIGVGAFTAQFARVVPIIASEMPRLKDHDPLAKPTAIERFKWQNHAFKLAYTLQETSREHGFFGINMASTGAGKTIGNARIMYGLADPKKGARFTIALGLRVLTLQTGLSFRKNLKLQGDQLAILVGGSAHKKLFELAYDDKHAQVSHIIDEVSPQYELDAFGSESSADLIDESVDSDIDYHDFDELSLGTVIASPKARDLLFAPIVTCTVDHIIQASECKRAGKYIAPMLRLLSSDLILDEPDDFDQSDLPALSRLMHLAGLMGTRVLLSSATLTPDLVTGLFEAYLEGRKLFNQSQNKASPNVVCAWFDEQEKSATSKQCGDITDFYNAHISFSNKRADYLAKQPIRHKAEILPLHLTYTKDTKTKFFSDLAQSIVNGAVRLHKDHHETHPQTHQKVSIGLVRIANVNNIIDIAQQLFEPDSVSLPDNTVLHVVCYHAKQLLILRNSLENKLDRILDRSDHSISIFYHDEINQVITDNPATHHIFMVLATPVAEVGRDHDYDWAIVEPSSMRSIIQLAGRVWRHRPDKVAHTANILLLQHNIRYFKQRGASRPVFTRPGFETTTIKPRSYDLNDLVPQAQLDHIDARPRIIRSQQNAPKNKTKIETLSELEHTVMQDLLNNPTLNYVNAFWDSHADANRAHTHLSQISPFRAGTPQEDWLIIPKMVNDDEDTEIPSEGFDAYYAEEVFDKGLSKASTDNKTLTPFSFEFTHPDIRPWLVTTLNHELLALQRKQPDKHLKSLAITYSAASLDSIKLSNNRGWQFHEFFGFVRG